MLLLNRRPTHSRLPGRVAALTATIALLAATLSLLPATTSAGGPRAHAATGRYLTGIGDEHVGMFSQPAYQHLRTKIVRYIAPYDAVKHTASMNQAITFIRGAELDHQQVLVAFYHSEYSPTVLPSVSSYQRDVEKFVKRFPHVRQYQSWDEANRGNVRRAFSSPSAVSSARYYQALARVCKGCTVIGLDVLDAYNINPTLAYISEFKREIGRLHTVMPSIWGLHNYSDINRLQSWRTKKLVRALGGQVWLTETGGIVKFLGEFTNVHGSGLKRAAKVIKYMFAVAAEIPQVKRLYVYDWTGGTNSTRFDAGLTNAHNQPREGYAVLCKVLHGSDCSSVKLAHD
ncbi:MAG TPA: hypothetical protein VMI13_00450 [Solirubrobacteraceae bacterium]|nr:hypothetical protein [Solirubrobacteraceae bacterium]